METPPKAGPDTKQTREDEEAALDLLHRWPTKKEPLDEVLLANPEDALRDVEAGIENLEGPKAPNIDIENEIAERLKGEQRQRDASRVDSKRIQELRDLINRGSRLSLPGYRK